ncbi:MAG: putative metal-binding motif-containing protein [Polyangiaceae bacterium]|nr:putative metal-binding motif-containing protein [Polyangiaceae bacterium]
MRTSLLASGWIPLALAICTGAVSGCGEVFVASTGGAGGSDTSGSAGATTGGSGGGTGGSSGDCTNGDTADCYTGPAGTPGMGLCKLGKKTCVSGQWSTCEGEITPATEVCEPGPNGAVDEDCDGAVDEGCSCSAGTSQPCYSGPVGTADTGQCQAGSQSCQDGVWGECKGEILPAPEICDTLDNNCDGKNDNFDTGCSAPEALGECKKGSLVCVAAENPECQPAPSSTETCDGKDNNCDGAVDNFVEGPACTVQTCSGKKACATGQEYCVVPTELCGNNVDDNCDGVKDPLSAPIFLETFSAGNAAGWIVGNEWEIDAAKASNNEPAGFFGDPADDATPTLDNMIAGVVIGGPTTNNVHDPYYLTSPKVNVSAYQGAVYLVFQRWLNSDFVPYMSSTVEVYTGSKWVTVWHTPADGVADAQWTRQVLDVTPFKNATFQVRFGVQVISGGAYQVSSWNIDDVRLVQCISNM